MNNTELENRIKKSVQDMQMKDFSARISNICEIAGKCTDAEEVPVLSVQPVAQTAGGNTGGRRRVKIAVISAICALVIVLAAVLCVVFISATSGANTLDAAPSEYAETQGNDLYLEGDSSYEENFETDIGDASTGVNTAICADEFYSVFENAGITVADFTIYNDVTYDIYYSQDTPIGGIAVFEVEQTEVKVEFYTVEYSTNFEYNTEVNGVRYAIYGSLTDNLMQQIIENLFE